MSVVEATPATAGVDRIGTRRLPRRGVIGAVVAIGLFVFLSVDAWAGNPITAATVSVTLITGLSLGSIYAMAATGIVVTYSATGIFNFAQGAIGMLMTFVFWELAVNHGLPTLPAILLTVLVVAPLFGVLLEVVLMRHLVGSALVVQLVVTVGLMFGLMGLAQTLWDPTDARTTDFLFGINGFHVGETVVLWHRALAIVVAAALAVGLRVLLHRTRVGVTMRAVVDNRGLSALHGARPHRISMIAWALASSTAALAGILLAPEVGVTVPALTLLTITAFAAAIVGRLESLPLTFLGAMALGLVVTFAKNFLLLDGRWLMLPDALPALFLLVALVMVPQSRIQFARFGAPGQPRSTRTTNVPEATLGMVVLVVTTAVVSAGMGQVNLNRLTVAIATATLLLSFIPLTGWAGQVSLAQITFAGIGAFTMWKVAGTSGNLLGLLAAAAVAVPFGCLMALPALRLHGLYLALASLAFALVGELLLFAQPDVFGAATRTLQRPEALGLDLSDQRTFLLFITVVFGLLGTGVVWLRRTRFGRALVALRDSEAACVTLGGNPLALKLAVYGLSAAMAGFAGALLALQRSSAAASDFTMLAGIPLLLLVVVGGVERMGGALFGGLMLVFLAIVQTWWHVSFLDAIEILGPGLMALGVAMNPDGAVPAVGHALAPLLPWRRDARADAARRRATRRGSPPAPPASIALEESGPAVAREEPAR